VDNEQDGNFKFLFVNMIYNPPVAYPITKVTSERRFEPLNVRVLIGIPSEAFEAAVKFTN
jgi:hypothetical protein